MTQYIRASIPFIQILESNFASFTTCKGCAIAAVADVPTTGNSIRDSNPTSWTGERDTAGLKHNHQCRSYRF